MAEAPGPDSRPGPVSPGQVNVVEAYKSLAEGNPKDRYIIHSLLMAYLTSKAFVEGIQEFHKLVGIAPESAQLQLSLGVLYEKYERGDDAIRFYLRAIELDPQEELAYRFLSTRYLVRGEFANAVKVCRMGIGRFPRTEILHFNLGYALAHLRKYDEAIEAFEKEVQVNPQCSEAYSNIDVVKRNKLSALKLRQ